MTCISMFELSINDNSNDNFVMEGDIYRTHKEQIIELYWTELKTRYGYM